MKKRFVLKKNNLINALVIFVFISGLGGILPVSALAAIHQGSRQLAIDAGGGEIAPPPEKQYEVGPAVDCTCSFQLSEGPLQSRDAWIAEVKGTKGCVLPPLPDDPAVDAGPAICKDVVISIKPVSGDSLAPCQRAVGQNNAVNIGGSSRSGTVCLPPATEATGPAVVAAKPPVKCDVSKVSKKAPGIGQLNLTGLSAECMACGNCTLDDIVKTGAAFANLLTQLSAAFFFATFVYGGAMYLLSFGDKGRVDKGKKAITGAAIGMLIVLMAWTVVNYIANSIQGKL